MLIASAKRLNAVQGWTQALQFSRRFETLSDKGLWDTTPERFALAKAYHEVAAVIGWDRAIEFGMKVWERKRPPSQRKSNPVHGGGRGTIYVPRAIGGRVGSELVAMAGEDVAPLLAAAFGGESLQFPCIVSASIARRNKVIAQQVADGLRVASVAWGFDLTERQVRNIVKQESLQHVQ